MEQGCELNYIVFDCNQYNRKQKVAELRVRRAALAQKKELVLAKLRLKLEEEEDLNMIIAIAKAKTYILRAYERYIDDNLPDDVSTSVIENSR